MKALVSLLCLFILAVGCSRPAGPAPVGPAPVATGAPPPIVVSKELRPATASRLAAACIRYEVGGHIEETCVPVVLGDITNERATECYGSAMVGGALPESCR